MSRAAGTLVSTYNATYNPPSMMPGYKGHVPSVQMQYGETFGNATKKHFNDYRNEVLNSSQSLYARGGYFPQSYNHNPELVLRHRRITRDQNLFTPKYELKNYHHDRTRELSNSYQRGQSHREQYKDRSGELHPNSHYAIPNSNQKMIEANLPYSSMMLRHKSEINIPYNRNFLPPKGVKTYNEYNLFSN